MHFFWGYIISFVAFAFTVSLLIAVISSLVIAILKEIKDYKGVGNVEVLDVVYTVAPSLLVLILELIK